MADRPILDVTIDTSAFDEYKKRFDDYSAQVAALPGEWGKIGTAVQPVSGFLAKMDGALAATRGNSAAIGKATGETGKIAGDLSLLWTGVSRSAKFFSHDVITATQSLMHWTKLTAVFGGLLGAGGLFGIDRFAMRAAGQRQSARGLGVSTGEYSAFLVAAARLTGNPEALLGSFSEGFYSQSAKLDFAAAFGSGVTDRMQGKDAASFFASILPDLKAKIDATPQNQLQNMLEYTHLSRRGIDLEMANRIKGMSRGEIAGISARLMKAAAAMGMPDAATRKLQDLETRLKAAGTIVETHLENKLSVLTPNLTSLTKGFEKFALEALKPDSAFDVLMKEVAGDIDWLSGKMEDKGFRDNVRTFAKDALAAGILIEGVAKAIGGAMAVSTAYGAWKMIGGVLSWFPAAAGVVLGPVGAFAAGALAASSSSTNESMPERERQRRFHQGPFAPGAAAPTPPANEGEDERARQRRFHQGQAADRPPMPIGVFPERVPAKPGSLSDRSAIRFNRGDGADGHEYIPLTGGAAGRKDSLSGMQPGFRERLEAMFRDAPEGSSVFSGYRSPALQSVLFNRPHRAGYVARPGHSHHGFGDAADIHGDLAWFHKHAAEYGLRFPMPYENWHIQADPDTKVPVPAWGHDHVERGSARRRFLPHREHVSALGHHPASLTRSEEVVIENLAGTFVSVDQG